MMQGIISNCNYEDYTLGEKARRLFVMHEKGFNIPPFFCVDCTCLKEDVEAYLNKHFNKQTSFALRMASNVEDSKEASFAGQFNTYLNIPYDKVWDQLAKLTASLEDESWQKYCDAKGLSYKDIHIHIIIQQMVDADFSGVAFTANPQGILSENVIIVGKGTGDNVVEDKVPVTSYYYSKIDELYYCERQEESPLLEEQLIKEINTVAKDIEEIFEEAVDIEYAIKDRQLFILQARTITTLNQYKKVTILDNSNIVESYPGITLPATQSFVRQIYYKVFQSCLYRLASDKKVINKMDDQLRHMVDVVNGRVYYRISNWYDILLLLPFSKKIIPIWQEMLGVKEKSVSANQKNKIGAWIHFKVTCTFFYLLLTSPRKMKKLNDYFCKLLLTDEIAILRDKSKHIPQQELLTLYGKLEKDLSSKWDITLANDMYAFIYTGLLKAYLKNRTKDYEAVANELISGLNEIESLKPIMKLKTICDEARDKNLLKTISTIETDEQAHTFLRICQETKWVEEVKRYINEYGDRAVEELKLESQTFRTSLLLFMKYIVRQGEAKTECIAHKNNYTIKGLGKFYAKHAALGIKYREQSRLNRSRIFGIVREILIRLGNQLCQMGKIEKTEDIFYLYYEEIKAALKIKHKDYKALVRKRKQQYKQYETLPAYTRLVFLGEPFHRTVAGSSFIGAVIDEAHLEGIPCSSGIVEGEVMIVDKPKDVVHIDNKILVTAMTDPGWVFLIAQAKGIIAEKGSLLSHTAIITRELKKPSIVGVKKALHLLKDGDFIRMNGTTGEITIIKRAMK